MSILNRSLRLSGVVKRLFLIVALPFLFNIGSSESDYIDIIFILFKPSRSFSHSRNKSLMLAPILFYFGFSNISTRVKIFIFFESLKKHYLEKRQTLKIPTEFFFQVSTIIFGTAGNRSTPEFAFASSRSTSRRTSRPGWSSGSRPSSCWARPKWSSTSTSGTPTSRRSWNTTR